MLLQLAAAGLTAAIGTASVAVSHNLTGLWTSDSTLSSGPWTDRYALTEAAGAHTAGVLCEYGGVPPSCSNVSHGQGGARPGLHDRGFIAAALTHSAVCLQASGTPRRSP